jgi:hypothetical protein
MTNLPYITLPNSVNEKPIITYLLREVYRYNTIKNYFGKNHPCKRKDLIEMLDLLKLPHIRSYDQKLLEIENIQKIKIEEENYWIAKDLKYFYFYYDVRLKKYITIVTKEKLFNGMYNLSDIRKPLTYFLSEEEKIFLSKD